MAPNNQLASEQKTAIILNDPLTKAKDSDLNDDNAKSNKSQEIIFKWQKAMKKAGQAQLLLQEVMEILNINKVASKNACLNDNDCSSSGSSSDSEAESSLRQGPSFYSRYLPTSTALYDCRYLHCQSCCGSRCSSPRRYARSHSRGHSFKGHRASRKHGNCSILDGYC